MTELSGLTTSAPKLLKEDKLRMFNLLNAYFLGVTWGSFLHDLHEKDNVLLIKNMPNNEIVGFSTIMTIPVNYRGMRIGMIFSGDTIVDVPYRNSPLIGEQMVSYFINQLHCLKYDYVIYFLISKGWRTYRIMPSFFKVFYPSPFFETPEKIRIMINLFAKCKYPNAYNQKKGLIVHPGETQRLRSDVDDAVRPQRTDPFIDFFFATNSEYLQGNELICCAEIKEENFTSLLKRWAKKMGL